MISQAEHRYMINRLSRKSILFTLSLSLTFISIGAFKIFADTKSPWQSAQSTPDVNGAAQVSKDAMKLEAGKPIERGLKAGELHSYLIAPSANQFLRVIVDQRGIDVVVDLFGPDGKQIAEVDSPNGRQGPEPVSLITQVGGQYQLDIRALEKEAPAGRYEVKIVELRPATSQDSLRITAERAFAQAEQLRARGTAKSLQEALHKYEEALPIQRALGDRREEANTLSCIGFIYDSLGEVWKAFDFYNQALLIQRATGDRRGEATMLHNIGGVYDFVGEKQKALDFYNQALPIRRAAGDRRGEAITLVKMGAICNFIGEKQKALDFYNQVLLIQRTIGDRGVEAVTLHNIGSVYDSVGEKQKALDFYNQSLLVRRAAGDRRGEAVSLVKMGTVYDFIGEKQKALDFYNQALLIQRTVGDRITEALALHHIGGVYDSLGEKQKALDFYNQALPIRRAAGDRRGEASTLNNMGMAYASLGEVQKALDNYNQALPLWRAISDRPGEATTLHNIGFLYDSLGEKQKALDFYNQALPILRAVGDRSGEANTLSSMGSLYESLGEKQKALDYLNQSLLLSRAMGARNLEARGLYSIARMELGQNQVAAAHDDIKAALEVIESLRTKVASPELRASYFASVQRFYDLYISLLMRLHQSDPDQGHDALALEASERARARTLLELLAEDRTDIRQGADRDLLERERSLRQLIDAKSDSQARLLSSKHTDQQAVEARKEIDQLLTQYQDVQAQIRAKSPRYAALTQPQPLSLNQIQREVVDADTLLLEYALGDDRSYLWAVTPDSLRTFELPGRNVINNAAQRLYELLTARNRRDHGLSLAQWQSRLSQSEAEYNQAAAELSRMILGPVASLLAKKRLLIVADGALNYVPFAALPVPAAARPDAENEKRLGTNRPALQILQPALIQEHEIINLPSASSLAVLRKHLAGRKPAPKAAAILADPVFDANDARVKAFVKFQSPQPSSSRDQQPIRAMGSPDTSSQDISRLALTRSANETGLNDRGNLPRLPFTRQEAEAIYAVTKQNGAMKALDFDANRETAASPDLSQYRIIHFATHGLLNNEHPELSGIVLSLLDKQGNPQNGFLRLVNVYNMNLSADLVVLSACQTALGKQVRGEGLVGLARGFMYAGAARVVASLWKVEDEATAELMKMFYESMMKQGQRPAAALRSAQIGMQKQRRWRSPYYWASFVLQGEWK